MTDYKLTSAKSVRLKAVLKTEAWLEEQLRENPALLGPDFEGVEFITNQKPTPGGGRLDLLLFDSQNDRRYVVELMLGSLDESHLVRTIEYWDIERRRFPAYEHIAVICAEDLTSRFLNVITLMAGNIPLIALQLNTLLIEDKLVLQFTKVLDLRELRRDDVAEGGASGSDRETWIQKSTPQMIAIADQLTRVIQKYRPGVELNYLVGYLGMKVNGVSDNFVVLRPRKKRFDLRLYSLKDREAWLETFREAKLDAELTGTGVLVRLVPEDVSRQGELLDRALKECAAV